ncbi:MAG: trypsin-like serine protease, partial [Planctomycetales bacterium]
MIKLTLKTRLNSPATGLLWLGVAAAILIAGDARGVIIRHDKMDSQYTTLAAAPQFDPVGRIQGQNCTGVLVASDWVLTAGHCSAATGFSVGGNAYTVVEDVPHPGFLFPNNDLRLLRLNSDVPGIAPAQLFTGSDEVGRIGAVVGFGATGTGLTGQSGPTGT